MEQIAIHCLQNFGDCVIVINSCTMWDDTAVHKGFRWLSRQECCCTDPSTTNIVRQWRFPPPPVSHGWPTLVQTPWARSNWPLFKSIHVYVGLLCPMGEYIYFTHSVTCSNLFFRSLCLFSLLFLIGLSEGRYLIDRRQPLLLPSVSPEERQ